MNEKKTYSITVRVTLEEWEIVDSLKCYHGNSASAFIRHLINEKVDVLDI